MINFILKSYRKKRVKRQKPFSFQCPLSSQAPIMYFMMTTIFFFQTRKKDLLLLFVVVFVDTVVVLLKILQSRIKNLLKNLFNDILVLCALLRYMNFVNYATRKEKNYFFLVMIYVGSFFYNNKCCK